jgi:hypothetical protein
LIAFELIELAPFERYWRFNLRKRKPLMQHQFYCDQRILTCYSNWSVTVEPQSGGQWSFS